MGVLKAIAKWIIGFFVVMQIISLVFLEFPEYKKSDPNLEIKAPDEIMSVFKTSCYDCHSTETNYPWYTKIAPISFGISRHVDLAKKWVNFSEWQNYTAKQKDEKLELIYKAVHTAMPLRNYVMLHSEADLTGEQRKMIREWTGKAPF
jgi:hypothetical protein